MPDENWKQLLRSSGVQIDVVVVKSPVIHKKRKEIKKSTEIVDEELDFFDTLESGKSITNILSSDNKPTTVQAWFDHFSDNVSTATDAKTRIGKFIALDCEMVGVGPGGNEDTLARLSIVNFHGHVLLDEYVQPKEQITDYRRAITGIQPHHLNKAATREQVLKRACDILKNRIAVGHALQHDFKVMYIDHPRNLIRDTSKFKEFRKITLGKTPSLQKLAERYLGISIQQGVHCSIEDARVAMLLYRLHKDQWEMSLTKAIAISRTLQYNQQPEETSENSLKHSKEQKLKSATFNDMNGNANNNVSSLRHKRNIWKSIRAAKRQKKDIRAAKRAEAVL